ncbi:hypothetical protein A8C32_15035 [Flavivirga aquatica]|uniref:Secretion system C-terminal sorting domain-containing protein n=2 Tax=Flavivirga aquatica TaxID=1849968 RepID=A0A1E5T8U0_9FLAO|nr:hypothetical protein A8C32_15035 [Flavivirga aquatica]
MMVFAFAITASAQFYSTDFNSTDFPAGDPVGNNADWNSDPSWVGNANNQIRHDRANWKRAVLDRAITASDGDFISAKMTVVFGRDGQNLGTTAVNNGLVFFGFKSNNNLTNFHDREGIRVVYDGSDFVISSQSDTTTQPNNANGNGANGSAPFSTPITVAANVNTEYEFTIEIAVKSSAATSTLSAKIDGSAVSTTTGIDPELYAGITGSGIYFWTWGYQMLSHGDIDAIFINSLTVDNSATTLSTRKANAFEFGMYPNPTSNVLNINTKEVLEKVEIIDLLGKTVLSVRNVKDQLNVSSINKGLYIIKLRSPKGISTKKFVKE